MSEIWFVVHQVNLWDIDENLIGFWNKAQTDIMSVNDLVIYYRAQRKQIMGVFKIIEKGINLNKDFYDESIIERPIHQCRLKLLSDDIICTRPTTETRLSFHNDWVRHRYGGLKKQVFKASIDDLDLILEDTSVVKQ